jgi:hypothetical protein
VNGKTKIRVETCTAGFSVRDACVCALQETVLRDPRLLSNCGCLPQLSTKRSSRAAARCGSADWDNLWFMHVGASQHFLLAVREFLNSVFL